MIPPSKHKIIEPIPFVWFIELVIPNIMMCSDSEYGFIEKESNLTGYFS